MLNNQSVESVIVLAQKVVSSGLAVSPKPATPLDLAVNECFTPELDLPATSEMGDYSFYVADRLTSASRRETPTGYPHDDAIETVTAMGAAATQRLLALARNDVKARITSVMTDIENALKAEEQVMISPVAVVANMLGGIWGSTTLHALVEKYSATPAESVKAASYFNPRDGEAVVQLLYTKTARFDAEVGSWVEALGAPFFLQVYNDFFVRQFGMGERWSLDWAFDVNNANTPEEGRNRLLAIFLMALSLRDMPEEESGVTLDEFRKAMRMVVEQAGRTVFREYEKYLTDSKSNTLLRSWPSANGSLKAGTMIAVNGEVYSRWLADGGCPEIILGSYVSDRVTGYSQLLAGAERYKKEWERTLTVRRSQANTARYNIIISAMGVSIAKQIAEMSAEDLVVTNHSVFHTRLNDELAKVSIADTTNEAIYGVVRHLICHTMYAHTQAESVLKNIDVIMAAQPHLEAREAALYAIIDMVVDWVYELLSVNRVPSHTTETDRASMVYTISSLANAVELASNIIVRTAGGDVSNSIDGKSITINGLADAVALKLQSKFQTHFTVG